MGDMQTQIEYPKGLDFEQVWAALMENREQQKETDRQLKEIGKRFGDFTNRFGEVVEYMIAPNLQDKLYDMGLDFQEVCTNYKVHSKKHNISFQVDVFLQNGDKMVPGTICVYLRNKSPRNGAMHCFLF